MTANSIEHNHPSTFRRLLSWLGQCNLSARIGLAIILIWLLIALIGPEIAPYRPGEFIAMDAFEGASAHNLLGSDYLGRDVLSRTMTGARYTIGLSLTAALLASIFGTGLALFTTLAERWLSAGIQRLIDGITSVPSKIFSLVLVGAFGSSNPMLLTVIALTYLPGAYRIAQSIAVNINAMDYVEVARLRGEGRIYIAFHEILPNVYRPMLADFGLRFILAMLLLSSLSFLGLGVQPPIADLGSLVRENISGYTMGALAIVVPATAIALITIGMNLFIDGTARQSK